MDVTPSRVESPGQIAVKIHIAGTELDPFENCLFLFCGRRRDRIKALYWESNGFLLLYKRLESGVFQWPRRESETRALTTQQYRWLMEGLSIDQPKAHRQVNEFEII